MGKRSVIKQQPSSKISKKDHRHSKLHHHQHHLHLQDQFDSLINDLKPKVYITDYSNFKQLVQDLTGNNNNNNGSTNISSITSSPSKVHDDDLHLHQQVQMISFEPSVSTDQAPTTTRTTTTTLSEEFCNKDNNMNDIDELMMMYREDEDHHHLDDGLFCRSNISDQMMVQVSEEVNDTVFEDILAFDYDQIGYLESLLLYDNHNNHQQVVVEQQPLMITDPFYAQIIPPPEISVYDYDYFNFQDSFIN